jgi:hypothetical protein
VDEEPVTLSARQLEARRIGGVLCLFDGERLVEVRREFGDAEIAARRFDALARVAAEHAEWIRAEARQSVAWT